MVTRRFRVAGAAAGALAALSLPGTLVAADFDGSKNLICAAFDVVSCAEGKSGPMCLQGNARTFDLAEFFTIDFSKKEIRATGENVDIVSPIKNQEKTDTQVVMQGVEDDQGWSVTVDKADGSLTLAVAGKDVSFMMFGACMAP